MSDKDQNFECYAGDAKDVVFQLYQPDGTSHLDITGCTFKWKAARNPGDAELLEKSGADAVITGSPALGKVTVSISEDDTDDFSGWYFHELFLIDADSNTSVVAEGQMTVRPAVAEAV